MKLYSFFLAAAACLWLSQNAVAQSAGTIRLMPDDTCFIINQPGEINVALNDVFPMGLALVPMGNYPPCFRLSLNKPGIVEYKPSSECPCRTEPYILEYGVVEGAGSNFILDSTTVSITIKCPKPDCALVNLEDFLPQGPTPNPGGELGGQCLDACEHSKATYYLPYDTSKDYSWAVTGGTLLTMNGGNEASIMVAWGGQGAGSITVTISAGGVVLQTIMFCVNILDGPTATWTSPDKSICKGQSVSFVNSSLNANSYFWDFGDGHTSGAEDPPPHTYQNPGTYTVCLIATKDNYDQMGKGLCCCSDTMCMEIVVDSLPGPNIYCLSTLCAGDESDYWTDATGCSTYDWTVLDASGAPWPFTGDGTPMIHVVWGNGPTGTVTLAVTGCNTPYCSNPSSITVPIIPPTTPIGGPMTVCAGETVTYSIPKWMSMSYDWIITGGGSILSPQPYTNTIVVQWFASGTLTVNYSSSFLSGLPDQNPLDCEGTGSISVVVKPRFTLNGLTTVCLNSTSTIGTGTTDNFNWTISPAEPFSAPGNPSISVTWGTAGPHLVTAMPFNPANYCNAQASTAVQVVEVPEADSIVGPKEICLNQPYIYSGYTSQTGVTMIWSAVGGTVTPSTGSSVSVTWTSATGPYYTILKLQRTTPPLCMSDTIRCAVTAKKLLPLFPIAGSGSCSSGTGTYYSLPNTQHPDAVYNWTIMPTGVGSIVAGQGTYSVSVQWNEVSTTTTATVSVSVSLCNTTYTQTDIFNIQPSPSLSIGQSLVNCAYVLTASAPSNWSTGATNTSTITVTTPGTYTATSTVNGCPAMGAIQVGPLPLPTASISTGDQTVLCISSPGTVTLQAVNGPSYSFQWYCNVNGGGYNPAGTGTTLIHSNATPPTNVLGNISYYVVVTGSNGCTAASNIITVNHIPCTSGMGSGCTPAPYTFDLDLLLPTTPNCNDREFQITKSPNVTIQGWNFGDPNSNSYTGPIDNPTHAYTIIGCRLVTVTATVPNSTNTGDCLIALDTTACIPIIADFSFGPPDCNKEVIFADQTTFRPGEGPSGPMGWSWNFGGTGTSNLQNPMHPFPASGTYTVTLTVTNAAGCQSTSTQTVVIPPMVMPTIGISGSSPYCVGEPIEFTGGGTGGITTWLWDFDNGSTNTSQSPDQSYLSPGTYTVTLTGANALGCTGTATVSFSVVANPLPGTITSPDTDLCQGETATLTAPAGAGWMWSNNATTQVISVTTAGTYTVVVADVNGCTAVSAPITVTVRPLPPAVLSGNPVICDNGCTTLTAPQSSPAYTYLWQTGTGGSLTPPNLSAALQVCANGTPYPPGTYQVVVTDPASGCSATSNDVTVVAATPPNFSISTSPTPPCEGDPVTLTLAPVQPNVVYTWSNGSSGSSIVVTQAGSYQAVGVDTLTGCSFAASATVHPLPDLCLVPAGCYKVCDPDTICGPPGLTSYQWNLNGVPITGANGQCLIVTQMGTYTLTGTNSFGCSATSDSLMLMVMPCDPVCDSISAYPDLAVDANGNARPCCFNIVVDNMKPNFFTGVNISVLSGGSLPIGNVSAGTGWSVAGFLSGTSVTMEPSVGSYLPIGGGTCAQICLVPTASTQQVLVEFLDANGETLCDTVLTLECEHCMDIVRDTIVCDTANPGQYLMTFCVHNANTNTFNANAVVLMGPTGVTFSPASFSLPNIPPNGTYCTLTTAITVPSNVSLDELCIGFTIHEQDVTTGLPPGECCMVKECFDLPDCCPHFATATPVDTTDGKCCWKITLNQPAGTTLSVNTNIVPAGSGPTFSGVLPPVTPWVFTYNSAESLTWSLSSGNPLPATITLPTVCFDVPYGSPVPQQLEIAWSDTNSPLCLDTLEFFCRPDTDCVALTPVSLNCVGGQNVYTVVVTNPFNSTLTAVPNHIALVDVTPASALVGTGIFPIAPLYPGNSTIISIPLQGPPGTKVCFALNAYRYVQPNIFEDCCVTDTFCVVLKSCNIPPFGGPAVSLYPNPTRENITLDFGEAGSPPLGWVRLRDVTGRLLREEEVPVGTQKHQVSMPSLTPGLYFVEFMENGARAWAKRVTVMR